MDFLIHKGWMAERSQMLRHPMVVDALVIDISV
jgi:hypothetical protein